MKINFFCVVLTALLIFSATEISFADNSANGKIIQIEQDTYGTEQTGAILSRITKLEKDYTGKNMQGNMNARIDAVYNILYENTGEASIIAKVNALEWNMNHEVQSGGIDNRIFMLEETILGKIEEGTFFNRIRKLAKNSFGTENIPMAEIQLPENTLVKVELIDDVGSKNLQVGDAVHFKVAEDVIIDNQLFFAKGLRGEGIVNSVRKANGWLAKNGKVEIDFNKLKTLDGRTIEIFVGEESKQKMIDDNMAAGASLVGMDLKADWKVIGKNVEVTKGTDFYIQTKNISSIYVLPLGSGELKLGEDIVPEIPEKVEPEVRPADEVFEPATTTI